MISMVYRTVYPWYRYDSLYTVIFSLSNIDCILTRTQVWGFALNCIPYGISIGADTVHWVFFQGGSAGHFCPKNETKVNVKEKCGRVEGVWMDLSHKTERETTADKAQNCTFA